MTVRSKRLNGSAECSALANREHVRAAQTPNTNSSCRRLSRINRSSWNSGPLASFVTIYCKNKRLDNTTNTCVPSCRKTHCLIDDETSWFLPLRKLFEGCFKLRNHRDGRHDQEHMLHEPLLISAAFAIHAFKGVHPKVEHFRRA